MLINNVSCLIIINDHTLFRGILFIIVSFIKVLVLNRGKPCAVCDPVYESGYYNSANILEQVRWYGSYRAASIEIN